MTLPIELSLLIIYNLPISSISKLHKVSKYYNDIINNLDWKDYFIYNVHENVKDLYKNIFIGPLFMLERGYYLLKVTDPKLVEQHLNYYEKLLYMSIIAIKSDKEKKVVVVTFVGDSILNIIINKNGCFLLSRHGDTTMIKNGLFKHLNYLLITSPIKSIKLLQDDKIMLMCSH